MHVPDEILVTGGAGFIGSHVVEYFSNKGASVTALDNRSRIKTLAADESRDTAGYNWDYISNNLPDVELIEGDIRDAELVNSLIEDKEAIVHTAGQVAVTTSLEDPRTDFSVNAEGTFNVLEAARGSNRETTVVLASTNKVYGDNINEISVKEEDSRYEYDDPNFDDGISETMSIDGCEHTPYGVSKLAGDLYAQDYSERGVLNAAAFRMSCIYGPRQFGNEDQGWVAHFAISTLRGEPITIFGNGKQVRDVLHVDDLVRAYHAFLADPEGKPAVYNIGGGPKNTTSLLEFLDLLDQTTGNRTEIGFDDWREGDQKVYISDISRAKNELGWEPEIDFSNGMTEFVKWYRSLQSNG